MEADGLIHREVYAQVPPKVEYSLTPLGASLRPVILAMAEWSLMHPPETECRVGPCRAEEQVSEKTTTTQNAL